MDQGFKRERLRSVTAHLAVLDHPGWLVIAIPDDAAASCDLRRAWTVPDLHGPALPLGSFRPLVQHVVTRVLHILPQSPAFSSRSQGKVHAQWRMLVRLRVLQLCAAAEEAGALIARLLSAASLTQAQAQLNCGFRLCHVDSSPKVWF